MSRPTLETLGGSSFSRTGLSPSMAGLSRTVLLTNSHPTLRPEPLPTVVARFGLVPVRSPLLRESLLLSFPEVT